MIYTGGASGSDFLVEQCALQHGMHVKVRLGPSHPRSREPRVLKPHVAPLTHQELMEANLYIERANKTLKRNIWVVSVCDGTFAKKLLDHKESQVHLCVWRV